ncbi:MAG: alkaline phosphatase D family protein [Acidimicrobiales bacterium]|nr:alkaline phosphatase D family protein [Acidimicrobiales bacterium]MCB9395066.1 alkaline phosphatase D family protein [Acidimicrobiaceae bacterium]
MTPISRRRFLAVTAATAAAAVGGPLVAACSDDGSDGDATSGGGSAAAATDPTVPIATESAPTSATTPASDTSAAAEEPAVALPGDPFTLGVASGDPSSGAVVLWTRLAPDPLRGGGMPDLDLDVTWEVSSSDDFADVAASGTTTARVAHGHSVHVKVDLDPGWWWYRFRVGEHTSPAGRTRTAPVPEEATTQVRLASASCQNYQDGFYTAHADIAAQQLDLVVFLGDYIYEGRGVDVVGDNFTVRTHGTEEPTTLEQYRDRYALYKSDPELQAAHASCPWVLTWDDHEVENNYAGAVPQDPADAAIFADRRRAAYQAWWEHQPVDLPPPGDEFRIHRTVRWGDLVELVVLDGRQYRSDQACGDPGLSLEPPCPETFDEARTMLGDEQEAWLLDSIAGRSTQWQAIAQQTIFGDVTLGGAVLNYDQWDGYPVERNRIVEALDPAADTVVLTGDIHFAGAGIIRQGGRGTGAAVASELVATSISSGGLVDPAVTEVVKAIPDIVDVELEHRGWILHTVTPDRWTAEYRMVDSVKVPDAPMFVHATYVIESGSNTVTRA